MIKIDPVVKSYAASTRENSILLFVKVKASNFYFSQHPPSNSNKSKRQQLFKEEVDSLLQEYPSASVNSYLANISMIELILNKTDVQKIMKNPAVASIKAIKEQPLEHNKQMKP